MRKTIFILLSLCLVLATAVCVPADVIVEPVNDFYVRHRDDCVYHGRMYYVNGEQGFVNEMEAPGSSREVSGIKNGEIVLIQFTYSHWGEEWGARQTNHEPAGWIPMRDLLPVYDYQHFAEEHADAFYPKPDSYETLRQAGDIVFWSWPGSGVVTHVFEAQYRNAETDANFFNAAHTYTDEDGREWGFFTYAYAFRNFWVCLSDPENADIPAFNPPPVPELHTPAEPIKKAPAAPTLIIALVASAVAATCILIKMLWRTPDRQSPR